MKWEICIATELKKDGGNQRGLAREGRRALEGSAAREIERGWRRWRWAGDITALAKNILKLINTLLNSFNLMSF